MIRLALLLALLSCKPRPADIITGIPAGAHLTCDFPGNGGTRRFCVADQVAYFCVLDRDCDPHQWDCVPVRSLGELENP